jgi:hypothetical protein
MQITYQSEKRHAKAGICLKWLDLVGWQDAAGAMARRLTRRDFVARLNVVSPANAEFFDFGVESGSL